MAVDLAHSLLWLASTSGYNSDDLAPHNIITGRGIIGGRWARLVTDIEALTAVILQRSGVTWDALAAPVDISKQALHRRLSGRGEELFNDALDERHDRTTDPGLLIQALDDYATLDMGAETVISQSASLGFRTTLMFEALLGLPPIDDVVTAADHVASVLALVRKESRWWWSA